MSDKIKVFVLLGLLFLFFGYSFYLYKLNYSPENSATALADKGKKLWQAKNCGACHQIYGLGGYLGPDLTNIYSTRSKEHIKAFLHTGTNIMPAFNLNDSEVSQIVAYLKSIDATGIAAPYRLKIKYDGSIER